MMKLMVTFRNFTKAPKIIFLLWYKVTHNFWCYT